MVSKETGVVTIRCSLFTVTTEGGEVLLKENIIRIRKRMEVAVFEIKNDKQAKLLQPYPLV